MATTTKTKTHAADIASAAAAKTAASYITTLFLGTGKFAKKESATLTEARKAGEELMKAHPMCTRRPMVYAILPNGSQELVTDATPAEEAKAYSNRSNAVRGAKKAGLDPVWLDFIQTPKGWTWQPKGKAEAEAPKVQAPATAPTDADDFQPPAFLAKGATGSDKPASMPTLADMAAKVTAGEKIELPAPVAPAAAPAGEKKTRITAKHQAMLDAAAKGVLPDAPDFSAATHTRYRAKLAKVTELAQAGDIEGLKAMAIKPICSSTIPLNRYRDISVMALEARAAKK